MAEQARRYAADVEWLLHADATGSSRCRARHATTERPTAQWSKYGLEYRRCTRCGTIYMSARARPGRARRVLPRRRRTTSTGTSTSSRPPRSAASEDLPPARRARASRLRAVTATRRGTLVDVGAGFGTFCEEVGSDSAAFERVVAVEPEPHLAQTCREQGPGGDRGAGRGRPSWRRERATSSQASRSSSTSSRRA